MLRQHILIKYSDLFQTAPDPIAYFEELRRSVGDIPLNIFATVNGYFSREDAGIKAQGSLVRELVSGIVRDMIGRFRQNLDIRDAVIFTRPSGLLNLKLLLAVSRPGEEYLATTVGMLALHANDYTDIALPEADAIRFAVENLPIWELHNPRDVPDLLARYYFITQRMYGEDERIVSLFQSEFDKHPTSILIDGLTFGDYFALLFSIHAAATSAGEASKTSILNLEEHLRVFGLSKDQADEFFAGRVAAEDSFAAHFGRLDTANDFAEAIRRPSWALDFSYFRERPLLRLRDGRVVVLDLQFLIENTSVGLFWNVFRRTSKSGQRLLLSYWGNIFEQYIQRQMQAHPPVSGTYLFNESIHGSEVDALLVDGNYAFVFEIKGGMLRHDGKCSRDVATVRQAIDRKHVANDKGDPKGVMQLVERCTAIAQHGIEEQAFKRVYPILVVEDPALQTPGVNTYLARRLRSLTRDPAKIEPLTVITADELELMLPYVAAHDITWQELIDARHSGDEVAAKPASTTFWELVDGRRLRRRSNNILGPARNDLAELLRRKYESIKF